MAKYVKCKYCGKEFNREKEPFVQIPIGVVGTSHRYAHSECYLKEVNAGRVKEQYTIFDPAKSKPCFWCHQMLQITDPDVMPMPQIQNRYVHKKCNAIHPIDDKEELTVYLIHLFDLEEDYVLPGWVKQINQYKNEYDFTYSGMQKTLYYWYEILKHPKNKTQGLGIIPYTYAKAKEYFKGIYEANLRNAEKNLEIYKPKDIEVRITAPKRQIPKRKLFTFLDEEEVNGE